MGREMDGEAEVEVVENSARAEGRGFRPNREGRKGRTISSIDPLGSHEELELDAADACGSPMVENDALDSLHVPVVYSFRPSTLLEAV